MDRCRSRLQANVVHAVAAVARALSNCPGCGLRSAGPRGCCHACWRTMVEPIRTPDVIALGRYRGALGAVLRSAKFGGATLVLDALGAALGALLRDAGAGGLPLVPVPSHPARRRRRGPDPSWRIARAASSGPVVSALRRTRNDGPQSRSRRDDREANVAGAFAEARRELRALRSRRVVLVDDVLTSGATARAAAAVLERSGLEVALLAVAALS